MKVAFSHLKTCIFVQQNIQLNANRAIKLFWLPAIDIR